VSKTRVEELLQRRNLVGAVGLDDRQDSGRDATVGDDRAGRRLATEDTVISANAVQVT
jgi:hypothetical protein